MIYKKILSIWNEWIMMIVIEVKYKEKKAKGNRKWCWSFLKKKSYVNYFDINKCLLNIEIVIDDENIWNEIFYLE